MRYNLEPKDQGVTHQQMAQIIAAHGGITVIHHRKTLAVVEADDGVMDAFARKNPDWFVELAQTAKIDPPDRFITGKNKPDP